MGIRNHCASLSWTARNLAHYPSWGSETHSSARRSRHNIIHLTTPHGDQKLPELLRVILRFPQLTTPHGDQKLSFLPDWARYSLTSLPLMGIRNSRRGRLGHSAMPKLTTPHGDQKPPASRAVSCSSINSLPLMGIRNRPELVMTRPRAMTHYPSWGSETAAWSSTGSKVVCSLPLMGIRNSSSASSQIPPSAVSLPLMGIRNLSRQPSTHRRIHAHYPSWGSETRLDVGVQRAVLDLTTPHGDQKRHSFALLPLLQHCSLPLMGIRNILTWSRRARASANSLPLMGIRNRHACDDVPAVRPSHYPSWGSETTKVLDGAVPELISLPLMGIRNILSSEARTGGR